MASEFIQDEDGNLVNLRHVNYVAKSNDEHMDGLHYRILAHTSRGIFCLYDSVICEDRDLHMNYMVEMLEERHLFGDWDED